MHPDSEEVRLGLAIQLHVGTTPLFMFQTELAMLSYPVQLR